MEILKKYLYLNNNFIFYHYKIEIILQWISILVVLAFSFNMKVLN